MSKSGNSKLVPIYTSKFYLAVSAYENIGKENIETQRQENVLGGKIDFDSELTWSNWGE